MNILFRGGRVFGPEQSRCDLSGVYGLQERLGVIRAHADANPARPRIDGGGWDMSAFPGASSSTSWTVPPT
jgi:hypothetical protein